jgi:hypothetical protein
MRLEIKGGVEFPAFDPFYIFWRNWIDRSDVDVVLVFYIAVLAQNEYRPLR